MYYIIYQTAFIGDIILSSSMIALLKKADPECRIIFITTPAGETILCNDKRIEKLIVYDKRNADKGFAGFMNKVKEVKQITGKDASVFISPHRFLRASVFGYLLGSKVRAGFKGSSLSFLYNRKAKYRFGVHEIERNMDLLNAAFNNLLSGNVPERPELFPSDKDYSLVQGRINKFSQSPRNMIAIAPGSVWKTKRWPLEYYKELINSLIAKRKKIILIGGKEDRDICDDLAAPHAGALNLAGELSVLQSAAAIGICAALVTNDSAPLHLASAMNTPTVAIFGATTPDLGFGPLADKSVVLEQKELPCRPCGRHGSNSCPKKHFNCMNSISPAMALDALTGLLM